MGSHHQDSELESNDFERLEEQNVLPMDGRGSNVSLLLELG
jgi:hypothetical protein